MKSKQNRALILITVMKDLVILLQRVSAMLLTIRLVMISQHLQGRCGVYPPGAYLLNRNYLLQNTSYFSEMLSDI